MFKELVIALMLLASTEAKSDAHEGGAMAQRIVSKEAQKQYAMFVKSIPSGAQAIFDAMTVSEKEQAQKKAKRRHLGKNSNGVSYMVSNNYFRGSDDHCVGDPVFQTAFSLSVDSPCVVGEGPDEGSSSIMTGCEKDSIEMLLWDNTECAGDPIYEFSGVTYDFLNCQSYQYDFQMSCARKWPFKGKAGQLTSYYRSPEDCESNDPVGMWTYQRTGSCWAESKINSCEKNVLNMTYFTTSKEDGVCGGEEFANIHTELVRNSHEGCSVVLESIEDDEVEFPHMSTKCTQNSVLY